MLTVSNPALDEWSPKKFLDGRMKVVLLYIAQRVVAALLILLIRWRNRQRRRSTHVHFGKHAGAGFLLFLTDATIFMHEWMSNGLHQAAAIG